MPKIFFLILSGVFLWMTRCRGQEDKINNSSTGHFNEVNADKWETQVANPGTISNTYAINNVLYCAVT